jgi:methionyl-tRNA formyltransferase
MKIALIGQAAFGKSVLEVIAAAGKDEITGVFAPPDREGRPRDPLAEAAEAVGVPLFQFRRLRDEAAISQFEEVTPDLCVMAFVTDFVPMEMINRPARGTIQYHPSLLPLHRGPSSINWPIAMGETETGLTIFWPDEGLDTGPVLLQKKTNISADDTLGSVYFQRLYPMGVDAMVEAIDMVRDGNAPRIVQDESQATYEGWFKAKEAAIDWTKPGREIYNLIRGSDPHPGANTTIEGARISFFDASFAEGEVSEASGSVISIGEKAMPVAASGGVLTIGRVRTSAGGKIPAAEFAAATRLSAGDRFGG